MSMKMLNVAAIIVTYNPELPRLGALVQTVLAQGADIVIVDNGSREDMAAWSVALREPRVGVVPLGENLGIAAAQNRGIEWARAQGATYVLIFDHDSAPPADLVVRLLAALSDFEKTGEKVAAVGPRYIDSRWGENKSRSPFSRFENGRMTGCYPPKGSSYVAVDFLIASGSLIPMKALDSIGGMIEELFIDYADIEWGLRARQLGWSLYGVWDVVMKHDLGDDRIVVLGRSFPVHSPLRHYYAIRNAVWLCCRSDLSLKWKIGLTHNAVVRFIAYAIFMPDPLRHVHFMCRGFWHGICGRMGIYR
jgi:rhamnosyltransferase